MLKNPLHVLSDLAEFGAVLYQILQMAEGSVRLELDLVTLAMKDYFRPRSPY